MTSRQKWLIALAVPLQLSLVIFASTGLLCSLGVELDDSSLLAILEWGAFMLVASFTLGIVRQLRSLASSLGRRKNSGPN